MSKLKTTSNFQNPDDFYELLRQSHEGLSTEESLELNTKLLLLLANHIGDLEVIGDAIRTSRTSTESAGGSNIAPRQKHIV
jgi:hypothetical protein